MSRFLRPLCDCRQCAVWRRYDRAERTWLQLESAFERAAVERREARDAYVAHLDELGRRAA